MVITNYKILTINPGSTSTKVALFENDKKILEKNLFHPAEELKKYNKISDQLELRKKIVHEYLEEQNILKCGLDAIVGRGGLLRPIKGGTYLINEQMLEDLKTNRFGEHAADLGGMIAYDFSRECNIPSYIVNPIVVDEMEDIARISGMPEVERISIFHALNQKAVAINYAKSINKKYKDLNLIVVHLGGGISVGSHEKGRVIDVNNALNGEGPFSPERSGGIPVHDLVKLCYSGKYTEEEMYKKINGNGGLVAYLNTNDARKVVADIEKGDKKSELIYKAMAYQTAKEIGSAATVLKGKIDAIIFTGGIANDSLMINLIKERVSFLGEVIVIPGEKEMEALAEGALRVLTGEEEPCTY
jgi:butyrate kinase